MKKEIKGYIAALISIHDGAKNAYTLKMLTNLKEFVETLKEEPVTDTYKEINRFRSILARFEVDADTETLRRRDLQKRVAELEESCENMNEVEKNLHQKIKQLESDAIWFRGEILDSDKKIKELEDVNSGVWEANRQIKLLNKRYFRNIKK